MHSFESDGYQFFYNGDYSGDIKVFSPSGLESLLTFSQLTVISRNPIAESAKGVVAVRNFVAEAVRTTCIRILEQMGTDELLGDGSAYKIFELVTRNQ